MVGWVRFKRIWNCVRTWWGTFFPHKIFNLAFFLKTSLKQRRLIQGSTGLSFLSLHPFECTYNIITTCSPTSHSAQRERNGKRLKINHKNKLLIFFMCNVFMFMLFKCNIKPIDICVRSFVRFVSSDRVSFPIRHSLSFSCKYAMKKWRRQKVIHLNWNSFCPPCQALHLHFLSVVSSVSVSNVVYSSTLL